MAFTLRNLSVLAYANGFTLWHYKAGNDNFVQTMGPGYFSDAADLLCAGDMVMLTSPEGGRMAAVAGEGKRMALAALV